jgi:hypothetical protein
MAMALKASPYRKKADPEHLDKNIPVHLKEDAVPYVPDWSMHRWVLTHAV